MAACLGGSQQSRPCVAEIKASAVIQTTRIFHLWQQLGGSAQTVSQTLIQGRLILLSPVNGTKLVKCFLSPLNLSGMMALWQENLINKGNKAKMIIIKE